jgi:twitching motility protein PilT
VSQLSKLAALLARDDIDEVVIATGRPVSVRQSGAYQAVSKADVSRSQLASLVAGTPIAAMVDDGFGAAASVVVGEHHVAVDVQPLGAEIMVRMKRAARAKRSTRAKTPTQSKPPSTQNKPRMKRPTRSAAAKSHGSNATFADLVREARARGASDLHIGADRAPQARILGALTAIGDVIDAAAVEKLLMPLLDAPQRARLEERGYVDAALQSEGGGRLRANISRARLGMKGTFRLVAAAPSSLEELGLPKELARVTSYHQGLVVIAGPSGHGKTTTLAALVELVNANKAHHVLTIEDPVEIQYPRRKAIVSQREVGTHTHSFATALKASLREDPDVIVIGELRDRETVEIALTAAETGHLVMATMSTPSAAKTLDRLIDMFPPDDQQQVRTSLAAALKFVVAQRLLPSADGESVVVAVELLTGVLPLAALIRDNKLYQVTSLQQRGRAFGMIRLDDSLAELVRTGRITEDTAVRAAENKKELAAILKKAPVSLRPVAPSREGGTGGK